MDIEEQIAQTMDEVVAQVFRKDPAEIAANHDIRFKEDLGANSKHYFPIIAAFEDKYGLMIDYHMFQYSATTVGTAIDYVVDEYHKQKGQ